MKILIWVCALFFAVPSYSKILIVSDIDDTLKNSNVLSPIGKYLNAYQTDRVFKGMPELLHTFARNYEDVEFVYITNAVESLMYISHIQFLKKHQFPGGPAYFRKSSKDENFKLETLRQIFLEKQPDSVIFFGDNAENDIYFYDQILKEFAIPSITYIRTLYSSKEHQSVRPLHAHQYSFITPLEILYDLHTEFNLPLDEWLLLSKLMSSQILSEDLTQDEGSEYFPSWASCEYQRNLDKLAMSSLEHVVLASQKIKQACRNP